jgi:uncharacterized membrane protein YhhN
MLSSMSPTLPPTPAVYLLLISLPLLVVSESSCFHAGHVVFKILSSIAFASGPLAAAEWSPYHRLITAGLIFSVVGDIFLLYPRKEFSNSIEAARPAGKGTPDPPEISTSFKLGVLAFAAAHVAYILAFLRDADEVSWPPLVGTFTATLVAAKWLGAIYPAHGPSGWGNILDLSISGEMRPLVCIYATIISGMVAVSAATVPASATSLPCQRLLGAVMFAISDLFVATDAFGAPLGTKVGVRRRSWPRIALGYGLYFWGPIVLAGTLYG